MGDLDISLIKEFAQRPGFYDRNHVHFKDKAYMNKAWAEIADSLGYEGHLLKDRIYQLRNRYNLEKRRIENIRNENPNALVESPWPLFQHLQFLDGHIRQRRSYKTMMRRHGSDDRLLMMDQNGNNNSNFEHPTSSSSTHMRPEQKRKPKLHPRMESRQKSTAQISIDSTNSDILIKDENEQNDDQNEINNGNDSNFVDPSNYLAHSNDHITEIPIQQNGISSRRMIGEESSGNELVHHTSEVNNRSHVSGSSSAVVNQIKVRNVESLKQNDDVHFLPPFKRHRRLARSEKYEAFGKFLAHSFCDLDEDKALALVEKFTTEVVRALITSKTNNHMANGLY